MSKPKGSKGSKNDVLGQVRWGRIVLDEGHQIKNHKTKTAKALFALTAGMHLHISSFSLFVPANKAARVRSALGTESALWSCGTQGGGIVCVGVCASGWICSLLPNSTLFSPICLPRTTPRLPVGADGHAGAEQNR